MVLDALSLTVFMVAVDGVSVLDALSITVLMVVGVGAVEWMPLHVQLASSPPVRR
jgi:hypothetical protein